MFLSKNLKRLRAEKGLTQEELAERLQVTGQAVSKWERNECYPDITLLPGLANCFSVTVDELLGIQEINDAEKWSNIFSQVHDMGAQGRYNEIIVLLEENLRVYPNNPHLLSLLGAMLAATGDTTERPEKLVEQALEEAQSYKSLGTKYATLCFIYQKSGAINKAEKLARSLPHARESRELLLPVFLGQLDREQYLRENIPGILRAISRLIDGTPNIIEEELHSIIFGPFKETLDVSESLNKIAAFFKK